MVQLLLVRLIANVRTDVTREDSQKEPNMTKIKTSIRFKAKLLRQVLELARPRADQQEKSDDSWTFLILPKNASAKLPSRSVTAIEGTINSISFQAVL